VHGNSRSGELIGPDRPTHIPNSLSLIVPKLQSFVQNRREFAGAKGAGATFSAAVPAVKSILVGRKPDQPPGIDANWARNSVIRRPGLPLLTCIRPRGVEGLPPGRCDPSQVNAFEQFTKFHSRRTVPWHPAVGSGGHAAGRHR
jgi:hypothetical protein